MSHLRIALEIIGALNLLRSELEQSANRSTNIFLTARGESRIASDWARIVGLNPSTLISRVRNGMPVDVALAKPAKKKSAVTA